MKRADKLSKLLFKISSTSVSKDDPCPCDSGKLFKDCHGEDTDIKPIPRTLSGLCHIRTNFEDADFWLVRKGTSKAVGKPVKEFDPQYIGIKVKEEAKDIILPQYLYYVLLNFYQRGYFENLAKGTLKLVHITTEDVKSIKVGNS